MGHGELDSVLRYTPDQTELLADSAARRRARELLDRLVVAHVEKPKGLQQHLSSEARRRRRKEKVDVSGGIKLSEILEAFGNNVREAPYRERPNKIVDVTEWRERVEREKRERLDRING